MSVIPLQLAQYSPLVDNGFGSYIANVVKTKTYDTTLLKGGPASVGTSFEKLLKHSPKLSRTRSLASLRINIVKGWFINFWRAAIGRSIGWLEICPQRPLYWCEKRCLTSTELDRWRRGMPVFHTKWAKMWLILKRFAVCMFFSATGLNKGE